MDYNHWLPGKRDDQLHMAKNWSTVLAQKGQTWNVPLAGYQLPTRSGPPGRATGLSSPGRAETGSTSACATRTAKADPAPGARYSRRSSPDEVGFGFVLYPHKEVMIAYI